MRALPVYFCPEMAVDTASDSPSGDKPARAVASWEALGVPLEILAPRPVTPEQLALAHDDAFVRAILSRRKPNGFGNRLKRVVAPLLLTNGAMVDAARHAFTQGGVAVAPVSGFHHAEYDVAKGFCTFNGLVVAARILLAEGAARVGILDADHHEGDGTNQILGHLGLFDEVHHVSVGERWFLPAHAPDFFARLPKLLDTFAGCDVVLYQAGADPHIDDPYGGWMTDVDLQERDARVFEHFHRVGIPVAWNLAGGYQRDRNPRGLPTGGISRVLAIHDRTLLECARVYLSD